MDRKKLLVYLPPDLLERANRAIDSPDSALSRVNDLVTEALGQYLDDLEEASAREPEQLNLEVFGEERRPERGGVRVRPSDNEFRFSVEELEPRLAGILADKSADYRSLSRALQAEFGSAGKVPLASPEAPRFLKLRAEILNASRLNAVACQVLEPDPEVGTSDLDQPLFGLHNRDYTSLWGLQLLAEASTDGPLYWSEFAVGLDGLAREFGAMLAPLDRIKVKGENPRIGLRYGSGFPKPDLRGGGSGGPAGGPWIFSVTGEKRARLSSFVRNNIARVQNSRYPEMRFDARGPLPSWGTVAFRPEGRDFLVGVSEAGQELLAGVNGISLDLPHRPEAAEAFIKHLAVHAPGDRAGLQQVLGSIGENPTREELVTSNLDFFTDTAKRESRRPLGPSNPEKYVWTMTQGYVARGREWGLIEQALVRADDGRKVYALTEVGRELFGLLASD